MAMATTDGQARGMTRVVVTGAASPLGRRVRAQLADREGMRSVVGVDSVPTTGHDVEAHRIDLLTGDLTPIFEGADAVLHLATAFGAEPVAEEIEGGFDVQAARIVLDAAARAGVRQVVLVTSATVYGPWANNPVPLTEDAPLRPHPDLGFAVQMGEIERLAGEAARARPEAVITRLRPATVVADEQRCWLAEALDAASQLPPGDDTPAQYLHLDDLADAVVTAWEAELAGPVNVAPPGWLTPTERRELDPVPRMRLPEGLAQGIATWRWRIGIAPTSPGVLAYARQSWVIAADRLVDAGWEPTNSNEEAYVAGHEASAIEQISPQRRQELALAITGGVLAAMIGVVIAIVRRRRRHREN